MLAVPAASPLPTAPPAPTLALPRLVGIEPPVTLPLARWTPRGPARSAPSDAPLVDRVLEARGLPPMADSAGFFRPTLHALHDPSLIPGLDDAATRILDAVARRVPLVIYGDYDVDGTAAAAILVHMLRAIAPDAPVSTYIPHRIDEGYGLNSAAVEKLAAGGAKLIVTVDCGITAREPARVARTLGVELIITDHHTPPTDTADLPDAAVVVHPGLPGSAYPFRDLCGAGVAYKLAWRLATLQTGGARVQPALRSLLLDLLAFAALGTVADVVPLVDENRAICRSGLVMIPSSRFVGLPALVAASGLDGERVHAEDVGFKLGPRLNACGRLGHAREALELMTTTDAQRAATIAAELTRLNTKRQATERKITEQAIELAHANGMTAPDRRAIVLAHEDWHPGVVGIVCSRLVERFHRPTILMQRTAGDDGPVLHGSGRSIDGFNLHAALAACAHHLTSFGGHDMAAGLRLAESRRDAFTEDFIHHANAHINERDLMAVRSFDSDARPDELTPAAVRTLNAMAPFGRGNPPVTLRLVGVRLDGGPQVFGKRGDHLALRLTTDDRTRVIRVIGWRWAERSPAIPTGARVEALVRPQFSDFAGGSVEPELLDLRVL